MTTLSNTINGINISISQIQSDVSVITAAKSNTRIAIDCRVNTGVRSELFEHYEGLCKRNVILNNVLNDLKIKVDVLEKEKQRCQDRSKLFRLFDGFQINPYSRYYGLYYYLSASSGRGFGFSSLSWSFFLLRMADIIENSKSYLSIFRPEYLRCFIGYSKVTETQKSIFFADQSDLLFEFPIYQ